MAGTKFYMQFTNAQNDLCYVYFIYENYSGSPIQLFGGPQPFVLSEFNSDNDLFKPIRPQQATIQILASISGVDLEDFLSDNDTDITIQFDFAGFGGYWRGILSQEDIEETWIAQNHILTLRADDGFGRLKNVPLTDTDGSILSGVFTPFTLIQYAANDVVGTFLYSRIFNNLFHESMTYGTNQTGLDQCYIDARTFQQNINSYDNSYDVIDKINKAWSQTLFQWNNRWVFLRIPEMFTDGNLVGFDTNRPTIGSRSNKTERYDINVAVDGDIKPIMPEMLKTVIKPSKNITITFDWINHNEIILNQYFQSGAYVSSGTEELLDGAGNLVNIDYDNYTVNNWIAYQYNTDRTVETVAPYGRRVERSVTGIKNDYLYIGGSGVSVPPGLITTKESELYSTKFYVKWQDVLSYSINFRTSSSAANYSDPLSFARIVLKNGVDTYYLDQTTGKWLELTSPSDAEHTTEYDVGENADEWRTLEFKAKTGIPFDGWIEFSLLHTIGTWNPVPFIDYVPTTYECHFSDFKIEITNAISIKRNNIIKGDYDRYTISKNVINSFDNKIYLDDAEMHNHKGAILESDGITLTNDAWYRRTDFNGDSATAERLTFKRHNAMSNWFMNRSYKTKLDVNLFGLKWKREDVEWPIGIINTIRFPDDAPTKIFAITNMSDVDFMNCTWRASLIEIFDTSVDENEPGDNDVHSYDYIYES